MWPIANIRGWKHNSILKLKDPSNGGKCTYCGNARYTSNTYFKLHGYPEWWHELQVKKKEDTTTLENDTGKATVVTVESQLLLVSECSQSNIKLMDPLIDTRQS